MRLATITATVGVLLIASGCGTQSPPASPTSPDPAGSPAARTASRFDPRWMALDAPPSWTESDRWISAEFQRFGLRPVGETELPRDCNGCGVEPPTAIVTAYAPGKFDPAAVRAAAPATVNADGDGVLGRSGDSDDAVLAWRYADDAWATVRGRTTSASDPGRMLELAHALRPAERTDIRVPVGIPGVPAPMALTQISVDRGRYGTTMEFGSCGRTDQGAVPECYGAADTLDVQIWPADGFAGHIEQQNAAPVRIGGRAGILDSTGRRAAVQVQPGILVVFELEGPFGQPGKPATAPLADLGEILPTVQWAPDPRNEKTWRPVADWVAVQ